MAEEVSGGRRFSFGGVALASAVVRVALQRPERQAAFLFLGLIFWPVLTRALRGQVAGGTPYVSMYDASPTRYEGSVYVPVDSWVYPVIERLAARGYVRTESLSIRPWTRSQCARLVAEAHEALDEEAVNTIKQAALLGDLDREFARERSLLNGGLQLSAEAESASSRVGGIAGEPLRDTLHFAQTISNDFGRPYGTGLQATGGLTGRAEAGPFALYLRGEYQRAAGIANYTVPVQQAISVNDGLPLGAGPFFPAMTRVRPIEAYVALNLHDWQLSFGQQSLWFGPVRSTGLLMTNNAEAMPMLRLDRVAPLWLPGPLRWVGPIRLDAFLARTAGAHFVRLGPTFVLTGTTAHSLNPQPYLWGALISFKPTPNLEFGTGLTAMFAGYGRPLTFGTFLHTLNSMGNIQPIDPGDRRTEFNFSYRLPGLRQWASLYAEGLAEDESEPLVFPRRSAMAPGVYLPQLPGARKLDLRAEAVYTNLPNLRYQGFFFTNYHYANGYTNRGQVLSSWVGPQGVGWQGSSTYWFSQRNTVTATYRRLYVDKGHLQGGSNDDFSGKFAWLARPELEVAGAVQYERWNFPLLSAAARSNVSSSLEVTYRPKLKVGR